jgi:glycosyltransferase 2 family protein
MRGRLGRLARNRRALAALQLAALALLLGALGYAFRGIWPDAAPRLRQADPLLLAAALAVIAAYYLVFVVGWMMILVSLGVRIPYRVAVQAEMISMLAKYVPGGIWTPVARVVALRKFGAFETRIVLASIALEAGLSALSGVVVFLVGLPIAGVVNVPLLPVVAFGVVVAVLVHPRVFRPVAARLLKPFGGGDIPPLGYGRTLAVLAFYGLTWPIGGFAVFLLLRSLGGDPALSTIPYLGGAAAIGAIVAVLAVFAPSGLGVREASMYGLILAVTVESVALGAVVLNRLAITVVEAVLFVGAALAWRFGRSRQTPVVPAPSPGGTPPGGS